MGTLLLLRPGAWSAATGKLTARDFGSYNAGQSRTRHVEYVTASTDDDVDISQADVILAIGRGIRSQENVAMMQRLADRMGVALAGTRPLIDSGWLPVTRLVGQSGTTVNPRVYLAFGVSGAVQHMSGIKGTDTIVAINRDETAATSRLPTMGRSWISSRSSRNSKGSTQRERGAGTNAPIPSLRKHSMSPRLRLWSQQRRLTIPQVSLS